MCTTGNLENRTLDQKLQLNVAVARTVASVATVILKGWEQTSIREELEGFYLVPMRLKNMPLWLYLRSVSSSEKSVKL